MDDYGAPHQALRRRWARVVASGQAVCARCGGPIDPGAAWHLDHRDDRSGYLGVSHARCNTRAGGRRGGRVSGARRHALATAQAHSRQWT